MSMQPPAQIADDAEKLAQASLDDGDRASSELFMSHAHAIRRLLRLLYEVDRGVLNGYYPVHRAEDVKEALKGYQPPKK